MKVGNSEDEDATTIDGPSWTERRTKDESKTKEGPPNPNDEADKQAAYQQTRRIGITDRG